MNLDFSEIPRLSIKSFSIDAAFGVVAVAAQTAFSVLLGQRASSCTVNHLFVWLPSLYLNVCLLCADSFVYSFLCRSLSLLLFV